MRRAVIVVLSLLGTFFYIGAAVEVAEAHWPWSVSNTTAWLEQHKIAGECGKGAPVCEGLPDAWASDLDGDGRIKEGGHSYDFRAGFREWKSIAQLGTCWRDVRMKFHVSSHLEHTIWRDSVYKRNNGGWKSAVPFNLTCF